MVLETTYRTPTGTAVVVDALAMGEGNRGHELGQGCAPSPAAAGDVHRGRGRDRRGVRPATRVRPGGSRCSTRSTADSSRTGGRRRPGPVVPGAPGRRRGRPRRAGSSSARESGPASPCTTGSGPTPAAARVWSEDEIAARLDDTVAAWQSWSRAAPGLRRSVARPRPPQRTGAPGAVVPTDRRDLRRGHHLAARGRRRRPATGTTATPGSGTRRSPSRRCGWRPAPTRPTSSSTT